ncbi:MAG: hypothetical protein WAU31_01165, partial [Candidatus Moraniibacteriota bacterium]
MRYIIALFVSLLYMPDALALCSWKDAECLAPKVLPMYDPAQGSPREWSAPNGVTFGFGNRIITRVRFDQEAVNILRSNSDFGIEIEAVLEGPNKDIELDRIESTFPSNAKVGKDTAVSDFFTNPWNSRNDASVHVLNPSAIEPEVDYFVFYIFKNLLPSSGVEVRSNLQITIDLGDKTSRSFQLFIANLYIESIPYLDQFQYFLLETDPHVPFVAYPQGYSGVCWTSKTTSAVCTVIVNQCFGSTDEQEGIWSRLSLWMLGIPSARADTNVCSLPSGGT